MVETLNRYKNGIYAVLTNEPIADGIWRMVLEGDTRFLSAPGQFVDIALDGFFLRRPISVCDWECGRITLIYKVVGGGTEAMARLLPGAQLDLLTGLGNGFDPSFGQAPLVVGGGVGVPPLYGLTKALIRRGAHPTVALGFNARAEMFYVDEFKALGARVLVATLDGSCGARGFVTDLIAHAKGHDHVYACGPEPMLRAVYDASDKDGQFSFEARMACGIGACMGCTCRTRYGSKRICADGPVLRREEILW